MKTKAHNSGSINELQFELKYCERCGGLWLRPVGGGQIYCAACGRAMGELPSPSRARMSKGLQWGEDGGFESYEGDDEMDLDGSGGVA